MYENQQQKAFQRVGRGSAGSVSSVSSSLSSVSSGGGGKVRQMFEERRNQGHHQSPTKSMRGTKGTSTGWDRSYPLEPIDTNTKIRSRNGWGGSGSSLNNSMNATRRAAPRGTSLDRSNTIQKNTMRRTRSQQQMNLRDEYDQPPIYGRTITRNHAVSRTMPPNGHYRHNENNNYNRVSYQQQQQQQQPIYQHHQSPTYHHQQPVHNNYQNNYYDEYDDDDDTDSGTVDLGSSTRTFKKISNVGASTYNNHHVVNHYNSNNSNNNNGSPHMAYATSNGFDGGSIDGYNYVEEVEVFPPPPVRNDRRVTPPREDIDSPPPPHRSERRFVEERKKPQPEPRRWDTKKTEVRIFL